MHPALLGTIAALSWGTLDFLAGHSSRKLGYVLITAGVTISGLILLTIALAVFESLPPFDSAQSWIALGAGAGIALATMCLFAALASGPISFAIPVAMSYPASTVVVFAAVGVYPSAYQLVAVISILVGAGLVAVMEPSHPDDVSPPGRLRRTLTFALLAHVIFLFSVLAGQKAAEAIGVLESAWISRIGGTALVLLFVFFGKGARTVPLGAIPLICAMGLLDVVGNSAIFAAGQTDQPELATVCSAAAGAITVILAAVFLKEKVRLGRWAGIALVFSGVSALSLAK